MTQYDYRDYEEMEDEVYEEEMKKRVGRKPKKTWSEVNKNLQRERIKKTITKKRRSSDKQ